MYLLNTRIDNLSKNEIISHINNFLGGNTFCQIATVNPEFLLETCTNRKFCDVLDNSNLNIADGIGIKFALWRYGKNLKTRYPGIDLMWDVLEIANKKNLSIYLVANKKGLSTWRETCDAILKKYPKLRINGTDADMDFNSKFISKQVQDSILQSDIIFVNFGAPAQELFLSNIKNISHSSNLRLGIGVGGSFDYITQKIPRAPKFVRKVGFEWLYRLIKQPYRFKRIYNAVVVFPILIILNRNSTKLLD